MKTMKTAVVVERMWHALTAVACGLEVVRDSIVASESENSDGYELGFEGREDLGASKHKWSVYMPAQAACYARVQGRR